MNERIDKLFEQALEEFKAENKYASIIVPNPLKEKFAELIVEECAKRAEVYAYMSPNFNALAEELRSMIGVEKRAIPVLSDEEEALLSGITSSKLFTIEAAKKAFGVKE